MKDEVEMKQKMEEKINVEMHANILAQIKIDTAKSREVKKGHIKRKDSASMAKLIELQIEKINKDSKLQALLNLYTTQK